MRRLTWFLLGFATLLLPGAPVGAAADENGGDKSFSIHSEVRFRGEFWRNLTDFTNTRDTSADDVFDIYPYRVRIGARVDLGHEVSIYGEFQGSGVAGSSVTGETRPFLGDDDNAGTEADLYQGWVMLKDVGPSTLDLTFGRQEIVFDSGLHFSSLSYYNGIVHDGVMAVWENDKLGIQAFWTKPFDQNLSGGSLDVGSDSDDDLLGVHVGQSFGKEKQHEASYYAYLQFQNDGAISGGQDRGKIYTIGARWERTVKGRNGIALSAEGSYQFGDSQPCASPFLDPNGPCLDDALDQKAYVFEGSAGYVWHTATSDRKLWGGLFVASGDDDPNDMDQEAFLPLYTDFHRRLGAADLFSISNITAIHFGYQVNIDDRKIIAIDVFQFLKTEEGTAIVSPLTGVVLSDACFSGGATSCEKDLGREYDLSYTHNFTPHFTGDVAIAFVDPGDTIQDQFGSAGTTLADGEHAAWRVTAQVRARF